MISVMSFWIHPPSPHTHSLSLSHPLTHPCNSHLHRRMLCRQLCILVVDKLCDIRLDADIVRHFPGGVVDRGDGEVVDEGVAVLCGEGWGK